MATLTNLFSALPAAVAAEAGEQFTELLSRPGLIIERIVSTGQSSSEGFWYEAPQGEWVLLVAGEAQLRFEDEPSARHLKTGDFLDIAAHRRHRVEWTPAGQTTIWLAIHYGG
ncbi:MAG: cupin [Candidatus Accumulibacter sp. UW20]|jgi:cupin 2 domain-containing protein